ADGGLQQAPGLEQLPHRLAMREDDEGQRLDEGVDRDVADEGALAGPDLDQPATLQGAKGLTHRGAADHELLGEVALGRQLIARLQLALRDQLLDLADDLLVDSRALDGLDRHAPPARPASRSRRAVAAHALTLLPRLGAAPRCSAPATSPGRRPRARARSARGRRAGPRARPASGGAPDHRAS